MCCKNLKAILEASGSEIGKVVRVGVFLTDMKVCDFESGSMGGLGKTDGGRGEGALDQETDFY
jgi:enamine deaminase RidA (YjgF/YER057c/UK114 family)